MYGVSRRIPDADNLYPSQNQHEKTRIIASVMHVINVMLSLNTLSDLSEPVDVYSDWIDACEAANQ